MRGNSRSLSVRHGTDGRAAVLAFAFLWHNARDSARAIYVRFTGTYRNIVTSTDTNSLKLAWDTNATARLSRRLINVESSRVAQTASLYYSIADGIQ